jgi:hypothetical protein
MIVSVLYEKISTQQKIMGGLTWSEILPPPFPFEIQSGPQTHSFFESPYAERMTLLHLMLFVCIVYSVSLSSTSTEYHGVGREKTFDWLRIYMVL